MNESSSTLGETAFHDRPFPNRLSSEHAALGAAAARGLGPLVLRVDEESWTYRAAGDTLTVTPGAVDDPWVEVSMGERSWQDFITSMRTFIALHLAGELQITAGSFRRLGQWEGALRALYLGIPAYDPTRVDLVNDDGTPLDLKRTFSLDDDDAAMAAWLAKTGFLHVTGVFTSEEIDALQRATQEIASTASPDDPLTWWATRPDGEEVLCRVIYAQQRNLLMGCYISDPRLERLASLLGHPVMPFPDRMDGPTLLLKPAGELQGLSNLPWHQDCGLGLHPVTCPSISLGIQITGSSSAVGRLEVIAGSQGQSVPPATDDEAMEGWPKVAVDTNPGDVTVHVQDVLHSSPPPEGQGGRATLYLSYYPPTLGAAIGPGQAVNDIIRGRQHEADSIQAR